MAELVLVFAKYEFPRDLQKDIHRLACEGFSGECHVPWTVGDKGEGLDFILNWIPRASVERINDFLQTNGAKQGQTVLIDNWW